MLSYLQHQNPLMRHNSKTWLMESAPFFFRILDPLLERLISALIHAQPVEQEEIVYKEKYNTEIILDTFNKIQ